MTFKLGDNHFLNTLKTTQPTALAYILVTLARQYRNPNISTTSPPDRKLREQLQWPEGSLCSRVLSCVI